MFGRRYQWIITGIYENNWWELNEEEAEALGCTTEDLLLAIDGYISTDVLPVVKNASTYYGFVSDVQWGWWWLGGFLHSLGCFFVLAVFAAFSTFPLAQIADIFNSNSRRRSDSNCTRHLNRRIKGESNTDSHTHTLTPTSHSLFHSSFSPTRRKRHCTRASTTGCAWRSTAAFTATRTTASGRLHWPSRRWTRSYAWETHIAPLRTSTTGTPSGRRSSVRHLTRPTLTASRYVFGVFGGEAVRGGGYWECCRRRQKTKARPHDRRCSAFSFSRESFFFDATLPRNFVGGLEEKEAVNQTQQKWQKQ